MPATNEHLYEVAYPDKLRQAEEQLLLGRKSRVGVAISGGGIRSATFALGVFQAIAKAGLLGQIAYMSTVSGGGYFGAFLGRLFHRPYVTSAADVEKILSGPPPSSSARPGTLEQAGWKVVGWLRENGRYLSPRGAGDLLLAGAVLLRNWVSIHVVLASFALAVFLALQTPRVLTAAYLSSHAEADSKFQSLIGAGISLLERLPFHTTIWWSPWTLVGLAVLALAIPPGWAYWLVPRSQKPTGRHRASSLASAWAGVVALLAAGIAGAIYAPWAVPVNASGSIDEFNVAAWTGIVLGAIALLTALVWIVTDALARRTARANAHLSAAQMKLFRDGDCRHRLSSMMLVLLVSGAGLLLVALIDSLAQTVYAVSHAASFKPWAAGLFGGLTGLGMVARQIVVLSGAQPNGKRPRLPLSIAAGIVGLLLGAAVLTAVGMLAHAMAWRFSDATRPALSVDAAGAATITVTAPASQLVYVSSAPEPTEPPNRDGHRADRRVFFLWLGGTTVMAFAFGRAFAFLNQSSHQMLYSARLTRAYLGASNPARWLSGQTQMSVVDPVPGDDIEIHEYWQPPGPGAPSSRRRERTESRCQDPQDVYAKGMPLHLVNVTINETCDGQSQIQQQDRKGVGMALGPAGMSVGIRHHVVLRHDARAVDGDVRHVSIAKVYPETGFKVFTYQDRPAHFAEDEPGPEFPWDPLSLGRWVGISGAAFSTGVGSRTSLGLSLLTGFANVRLGYWWDSGIDPSLRADRVRARIATRLGRIFVGLFPVQAFLLSEFLARFPGTAQRRWYLSDGGHFENMGAYELIRRRLPLILVIDAEADPGYTFEGLSNLVRKARLDFQTEIEFLDEEGLNGRSLGALAKTDDPEELRWARLWGPLEKLRPVRSKDETDAADGMTRSAARFALASVRYPDDGMTDRQGWLVYLKPTLMGTEPADITEYARSNSPFPQQTTIDQFFDEAQWESYRKLGEYLGSLLLDPSGSTSDVLDRLRPQEGSRSPSNGGTHG